eukprot:ANDGO_03692.mRNA.1 Aldose 1-epimerase
MRSESIELRNESGAFVRILPLGGTISHLCVPDRKGVMDDVVLGFDDSSEYPYSYFGCVAGRYANRIANAKFSIDGKEFGGVANNGPNMLHGGPDGFDRRVWTVDERTRADEDAESKLDADQSVTLRLVSPDGDQGFPGTLHASVKYSWSSDNALAIDYEATVDEKPTIVNLTQHSYFNLLGHANWHTYAGSASFDVLHHTMQIFADSFTPVSRVLIPTGERAAVAFHSPFDFYTNPKPIGKDISAMHEQLEFGNGYDHNFCLVNSSTEDDCSRLSRAAYVVEPLSGRTMAVYTSEPGMQFYSGNFLDGERIGKCGVRYGFRSGFCLETQHFPDSPNQPGFPSTVLRPGSTYVHRTIYKFGTAE